MSEDEKIRKARELIKLIQDEFGKQVLESTIIRAISEQIYRDTGLRLNLRLVASLEESKEVREQAQAFGARLWDVLNQAILLDKAAGEIFQEMANAGFEGDCGIDVRVWKIKNEAPALLERGTVLIEAFTEEDKKIFGGVLKFDEPVP